MTPVATSPATARGATVRLRRPLGEGQAHAFPRRVSGPTRRRPAQGSELLRRVGELADSRLLVRLTRGRAWIAVIGVMLMGLVFVQVSMLRLNTGVGRDVATATQLERANQQLRNSVADLGAGERIETAAQKLGMVMPAAGDVRYLRAGAATPDAAARGISAPAPVQQQPVPTTTAVVPAGVTPAATAVAPTGVTPAATGVAPAAVTPAAQQQPVQQQAPVTPGPQQQLPVTTPPPTAVAAGNGGAAPTP